MTCGYAGYIMRVGMGALRERFEGLVQESFSAARLASLARK